MLFPGNHILFTKLSRGIFNYHNVVCLLCFVGTSYIDHPGTKMVVISGDGTEATPVNQNMEKLSIEDGASVIIESDVTINEIVVTSQDSTCELTVASGKLLTVTKLGKYYDCL